MFYNNKGKSFEENVHFNIPFEDDKNKNKDKNQNKTGKAKGSKFSPSIGLDIKSGNININPSFSATVPIAGPFEAKFGISGTEAKVGAGVGFGQAAYAGGFASFDFQTGTVGLGAEVEFGKGFGAEAKAGYNWEDDKIDFTVSVSFLHQKIDLIDVEVKDVAQNLIGKPLDNITNALENIHNHISPEAKERARVIEDIRGLADNCKDIGGLNNILSKWGESQAAIKGNEAAYAFFKGEFEFLNNLNEQVYTNADNIANHEIRLNNIDKRLDDHDIILANHGKILANHEARIARNEVIIRAHEKMLNNHERRIQRHERIIGIHEQRLNQHDRILSQHSSMLQNHEQRLNEHANAINKLFSITNEHGRILNIHGQKLNELDKRMTWAEDSIMKLNKQVNIHSEMLYQHGEILNMHGEAINELYNITNEQQIQLNMHTRQLNDHQNAIVELFYNYNNLKERVEKDEEVINNIGEEVNKVIKFSVDTRDIVDGLAYQTQIHKDLIIQNHNDCIEIRKELINQANFIRSQSEFMKELSKENKEQWKVLERHEKEIQEIKEFVNALSNEIQNIYQEIKNINIRVDKLEEQFDQYKMERKMAIVKKAKRNAEEKSRKLTRKVNNFDEQKKSDFAKSMIIARNNGILNLDNMEIVASNIENYR